MVKGYLPEKCSLASNKMYSLVLMLLALLPAAHAGAAIPLSDGRDGVTCRHFATAANMAWQQPGGDWADSTGTPYGASAYAMEDVPVTRVRQVLTWDLTGLVREWQSGAAPAGAIFIMAAPGKPAGKVNFNSRESADPSARPSLVVEWGDGSRSRMAASADAHLPCSTSKSIGGSKTFQVASDVNAVMAFPFDRDEKRRVVKAELLLTTDKQYFRTTSIGVFRPILQQTGRAESISGLSAKYPGDRGISADHAVLFSDSFESSDWASRWATVSDKSTTEIIDHDAANRFESLDGRALKVSVFKGKVLGLNATYRFDSRPEGEPEEMYFRYCLRFGESWNPTRSGGKLPGFAGTYNRGGWGGRTANGVNGWSARGTFFRCHDSNSPLRDRRAIGSYVYHAGMSNKYGSTWGWNEGPTGMLAKNRWYSIEQYVRLNTPGRNDGVLRAWVDGKLAFERTDLRYRDVPDLKIETLWMNVYHGGTTPTDTDLALYIDNVVIAKEYIGPFQGGQ